jgi:gas vesicle protein
MAADGQSHSSDNQSLVMKLQLENAELKDKLEELGGDTPTVPLEVYQQLKEAQEQEIMTLKQEIHDVKQQKSDRDNEVCSSLSCQFR